MKRKALILGVTGMDGSHLADLLLEKGYEVHGVRRRTSLFNTGRIDHLRGKIDLHYGELLDPQSLYRLIKDLNPHEIYNEADQDSAAISFELPHYATRVTGGAVGDLLEIVKNVNPGIRVFQPLTSNMFGAAASSPQNEDTPLNPKSPYAAAKCYAKVLCKMYREVYGVQVSTATFYNHTSERQHDEYLIPKIIEGAKKIHRKEESMLVLQNMNAEVDVGYAPEFMEMAWKINNAEKPDDFVIGTGESYSVNQFVSMVFAKLKIPMYLAYDKGESRPGNTANLVADYGKANAMLGFVPHYKGQRLIDKLLQNAI